MTTVTFPIAVKLSDIVSTLIRCAVIFRCGLPCLKHDAVVHAVDCARRSVGRELRIVIIEAPRLGDDATALHATAA